MLICVTRVIPGDQSDAASLVKSQQTRNEFSTETASESLPGWHLIL